MLPEDRDDSAPLVRVEPLNPIELHRPEPQSGRRPTLLYVNVGRARPMWWQEREVRSSTPVDRAQAERSTASQGRRAKELDEANGTREDVGGPSVRLDLLRLHLQPVGDHPQRAIPRPLRHALFEPTDLPGAERVEVGLPQTSQ